MKYLSAIILFSAISLAGCYSVKAQIPLINNNSAFRFNINAEVRIKHKLFLTTDSIRVTLLITANENVDFADKYRLSYSVLPGYDSDRILLTDSISQVRHMKTYAGGTHLIEFGLEYKPDFEVLVIRTSKKDTNASTYYDIYLDRGSNPPNGNLLLIDDETGIPVLDGFIRAGQPLSVRTLENRPVLLYGFHYKMDFPEALPPMVTEDRPVGRDLRIDSVFSFNSGQQVVFNRNGLFFIQRDTTTLEGLGFRVENPYYPLVKTFDQLIGPLIYLSTAEETRSIRSSTNPRQAFENHWVKWCGSQELAARTIGLFYEAVAEANFYFTSFKEGWKTDMGMTYIIFGRPDEVYNNEETVDWVYNSDLSIPAVRFSFYKVNTIFSDNHYTLLRRKNYDRSWFRMVESWRKGTK